MTPPPHLPVRRMTEWDFYGILWINFPAEMPWEEARRNLEWLIRRNGDTEITPLTVYSAFAAEERRMFKNLPPIRQKARLARLWRERLARNAEKIAKLKAEKAAEKKPADDWNF